MKESRKVLGILLLAVPILAGFGGWSAGVMEGQRRERTRMSGMPPQAPPVKLLPSKVDDASKVVEKPARQEDRKPGTPVILKPIADQDRKPPEELQSPRKVEIPTIVLDGVPKKGDAPDKQTYQQRSAQAIKEGRLLVVGVRCKPPMVFNALMHEAGEAEALLFNAKGALVVVGVPDGFGELDRLDFGPSITADEIKSAVEVFRGERIKRGLMR